MSDKPCTNCGHCPTCGRSNFNPYTYPYPIWISPFYPYGGTTTNPYSGGTPFITTVSSNSNKIS